MEVGADGRPAVRNLEVHIVSDAYLGWDIGGAHLKLAWLDAAGRIDAVRQVACPLWQGVGALSQACAEAGLDLAAPDLAHAITMTGELCDVFERREDGVRDILAFVQTKLHALARVAVYAGESGWLDSAAAGRSAPAVASANWRALADFAALSGGDAIVLDIGSTTTDILPLASGRVACRGRDDRSRLACGELVYTGVARTPVFGVCAEVPLAGVWQPLVPEYFATMADVYILLGELRPNQDLMPSADGRNKDELACATRLARALGMDLAPHELPDVRAVARYLAEVQRHSIWRALELVASRGRYTASPPRIIGAGVGRFVARQLASMLGADYVDFATLAGADAATAEAVTMAAPAVAVAKLLWMRR